MSYLNDECCGPVSHHTTCPDCGASITFSYSPRYLWASASVGYSSETCDCGLELEYEYFEEDGSYSDTFVFVDDERVEISEYRNAKNAQHEGES